MTERLIRLIRMIIAIQSKPGITAKELAEKCEATERTIYRDLNLLAIVTPLTNEGYGKGYTFMGNFAIYPLNWTEQEALVFSMLPKVMDQVQTLLPPGFDSAYEKVMATYNKQRSNHKEILEQITEVIQMGTPAYREDSPNYLYTILQASLEHKSIKAIYHTQSRNTQTERIIDPYYLVPRDQRFYLLGYCHTAGAVRTFRISRFREVTIMPQTYEREDFNIKSYLKNTWSIERGDKQIKFKVKFYPDVARYIKEEELFVRPRITDLPDGGLLFEVTVNDDREFLNWVYQYGPSAEILEPVSYRVALLEQLDRWKSLYSKTETTIS
ncbi:transcriptional regulator [Paenibacillus swuensis]|uniref:Transcriptional regulator n=1 Tax=Paenibacillus swuensis TaxID=1178515 RepID=A0A172TEB1_9BACL|nr:WYL domain-containing transcriptional regulator [Paenibacillus swuensis]ANE45266.1 transcriptional regulator [Paenibacillus swuensis]